MSLLEIDLIKNALSDDMPGPILQSSNLSGDTRRAAVATILRRRDEETEALFIQRSIKESDPWSGQMAFPGGHLEATDESLRHAAERETFEEIGLDLSKYASYVGPINEVRANPRGRNLDMIVSPFVYILQDEEIDLNLNYEVADVLWGSLNGMYHGLSNTELEFNLQGQNQRFPGYSVGDQVVWGLTRSMLHHLFTMINPEWAPHDDVSHG
ncbi:MAG: 8-oxo-dGTP pyrophosphatase MutT (NUDIX family) [Candidatus Azotimanducaceae bacterium]|jgi:8-oxo-dGTP pyrophosphatase MutT (NUDIX family)